MRKNIWPILVAFVFTLACGSGDDPDPTTDAGTRDAGPLRDGGPATASVEIGTGQDAFVPLAPGGMLPIERGAQAAGDARYNGFHVWFALRARGVEPTLANLSLEVRAAGAVLASGAYRQTLVREGDDYVLYGQRLILSDCCAAENAEVEVHVELQDALGWTGTDTRMVLGGECIRGLPNPTIDPCP